MAGWKFRRVKQNEVPRKAEAARGFPRAAPEAMCTVSERDQFLYWAAGFSSPMDQEAEKPSTVTAVMVS